MAAIWTVELDEELREMCEKSGYDPMRRKAKWWDDSAKGCFSGMTGKQLQQRWGEIRHLPGLEYKSFARGLAVETSTKSQSSSSSSSIPPNGGGKSRNDSSVTAAQLKSAAFSRDPATGWASAGLTSSSRRPMSASAIQGAPGRIRATRQSAVGQLRGAALASSHAPLIAFNTNSGGGSKRNDGPSPKAAVAPSDKDKDKDKEGKKGGVGGGSDATQGTGATSAGKPPVPPGESSGGKEEGGGGGGSKGDAGGGGKGRDDNMIVIHVCDEGRRLTHDFRCPKHVLLSEMAYFRSYLDGTESADDIDISVHCDMQIFQWLMCYLNEPNTPPQLTCENVVSVLISSQYLKMQNLVKICVNFMCKNLDEILKMTMDLNCLNQDLLKQMAATLTVDELDALQDRRDRLLSKIYMKKLEALLTEEGNQISRCSLCGALFAIKCQDKLICPSAKIFIDFRGKVLADHVPAASFDINKLLLSLRARKLSWREIYWRIWGVISTMDCSVCKRTFRAYEYGHCSYCPAEPVFNAGQNKGVYPCCKTPALRFDSSSEDRLRRGCCAKEHAVSEACSATLSTLLKRKQLVCLPFGDGAFDEEAEEEGDGGEDAVRGGDHEDEEENERDAVSAPPVRGSRAAMYQQSSGAGGGGQRKRTKGGKRGESSKPRAGENTKDYRSWRAESRRDEDLKRMQDAWEAIEDAANSAFPSVPSEKAGSGASGGGSGGGKVVEGEGRKLPRPSTGVAGSRATSASIRGRDAGAAGGGGGGASLTKLKSGRNLGGSRGP